MAKRKAVTKTKKQDKEQPAVFIPTTNGEMDVIGPDWDECMKDAPTVTVVNPPHDKAPQPVLRQRKSKKKDLDELSNQIEEMKATIKPVEPKPIVPLSIPKVQRKFEFRKWYELENLLSRTGTAHVIAAGPSAKPFLSQLAGRGTAISINAVPAICPTQFWYCCDRNPLFEPFAQDRNMTRIVGEQWLDFTFELDDTNVFYGKNVKCGFISTQARDGIYHGMSSTVGAVEIARLMGAKTIVLWGVDYTTTEHSYDAELPQAKKKDQWQMEFIMSDFNRMAENYKFFGIEILQTNSHSLINQFNYIDPHAALRY